MNNFTIRVSGSIDRRVNRVRLIMLVLCAAAAPRAGAGLRGAADEGPVPPAFGATLADGKWRAYTWSQRAPDGAWHLTDELVAATVSQVGSGEWELALTAKQALRDVWFPWPQDRCPLNTGRDDAVIYYPTFMGVVYKASALKEWDWRGNEYPGGSFAPLVILADGEKAKLVAATTWPPQRVKPMYSLDRLALAWLDVPAVGATQRYRATIREFSGDAAKGQYPWHAAVDAYRTWLHAQMHAAGLYPIPYSPAVERANGWLNWQLNGYPTFDADVLERYAQRWSADFPWIQFWGQMSNFAGEPAAAVPPLRPGEETGCCLAIPEMHARYKPELPPLIKKMRAKGTRVGLYARPRDPYQKQRLDDDRVVDGQTNLQFLLKWVQKNREEYGADAIYIDTLGNYCFADPLFMATLLRDQLGADTVIEGVVDVYPCAFLLSGFIGGGAWGGGPQRTLENLGRGYDRMTYPAFGRYLLNDRVIFVGESNRDWNLWGHAHEYWVERQAFLLGAKLDAMHPYENDGDRFGPMNVAVARILAEWQHVGWWARRPLYCDRAGISDVPPGIDVRRFRGKDGEDLFVIDNWRQQSGRRFRYAERWVEIPSRPLCIAVWPAQARGSG